MGSVIGSDEGQKFVKTGISPFLWKKWPIRKRLDSYMKNIMVVSKTNDWSIRKDGTPQPGLQTMRVSLATRYRGKR